METRVPAVFALQAPQLPGNLGARLGAYERALSIWAGLDLGRSPRPGGGGMTTLAYPSDNL